MITLYMAFAVIFNLTLAIFKIMAAPFIVQLVNITRGYINSCQIQGYGT